MGFQYSKRRFGPGVNLVAQETLTDTAVTLSSSGLTILGTFGSSTADKVFVLPRPDYVGQEKTVLARTTGAQKVTATVAGATASGFFENSTFRSIVFSSQSTKQKSARLVAYSTNTWAIVAKSTGATLL